MEEGGVAGGGGRLRVGGWGVKLGLGNGGGPVIYAWIWAGPNGPDVGVLVGELVWLNQLVAGWLGLPGSPRLPIVYIYDAFLVYIYMMCFSYTRV